MNLRLTGFAALIAAGAALSACGQPADEDARVVNVYSSRHYSSDEAVFAAFTESTGIEVNLLSANGDQLIERVRADGERSPADVIITVDAARLHRAETAGLFQQTDWTGIGDVADHLRDPEGYWIGFSQRARVIAVHNERVAEGDITRYADLADPRFEGRICVRSSDNAYNQSLLASIIAHDGVEAAEEWAAGVNANMARAPQGGDTAQILAIAAGECDVAIVNHYYFAMMARSDEPANAAAASQVSLVFPNQDSTGAHVNISGAGIAVNAPHPEEARALIEFMLSAQSQRFFAELTNEIPVIADTEYDNPVLDELIDFRQDTLNVSILGDNNAEAVRVFDRVGWP